MDYFEIVIFSSDMDSAINFFVDKFSEAKEQGIDSKTFYLGCLEIIWKLEENIDKQYNFDKDELLSNKQDFDLGIIGISENYKPELNYHEKWVSLNKEMKNELQSLSKQDYSVDLRKFNSSDKTLGWSYITLEEIKQIENYLNKAKTKVELGKLKFKAKSNLNDSKSKTERIGLKVVALKYIYENEIITRDNANQIALKYSYTSKKSGERLYQDYNALYRSIDRRGDPGSKTKVQNRIKLIQSVVKLLHEPNKKKPFDELKILKTILEKRYN